MTKLSFRLNSNSGRIFLVHLDLFTYSSLRYMETRLTRGPITSFGSVYGHWYEKEKVLVGTNCPFSTSK